MPYFLKAFEERRSQLAKDKNRDHGTSREQPCSVLLFKAVHEGKIYLLHQWDQKAERYQLIGGKQPPDETPLQTAIRSRSSSKGGEGKGAGKVMSPLRSRCGIFYSKYDKGTVNCMRGGIAMAIKANVVVRKGLFVAELSDGQQIERIDLGNMARALCMEGVKADDLDFDWRPEAGILTAGRQVALIAQLRQEQRKFHQLLAAA